MLVCILVKQYGINISWWLYSLWPFLFSCYFCHNPPFWTAQKNCDPPLLSTSPPLAIFWQVPEWVFFFCFKPAGKEERFAYFFRSVFVTHTVFDKFFCRVKFPCSLHSPKREKTTCKSTLSSPAVACEQQTHFQSSLLLPQASPAAMKKQKATELNITLTWHFSSSTPDRWLSSWNKAPRSAQ